MPIYTRVSGTWREVEAPSVRVSGTWRDVDEQFVRVGGTWRSTYIAFNSGPGSTTMQYDSNTDTGYYGLVDSGDFISGDALCSDIGLSVGTSQHSDTPWMKFYIGENAACNAFVRRGETAQAYVAFIPQKPIRYNLSWDSIYNAGAVFGTGDNGPYGTGEDSPNVTQDAQVTIDTKDYIVRLLTCAKENPFPEEINNTWACDDNIGEGSEWNNLIYRVHTDSPNCDDPTEGVSNSETTRHGGPQDGDNWANFTDNDLLITGGGDGAFSWGQETRSDDTSNRALRGFGGVGGFVVTISSMSDPIFGFRPVLELIQS